MKVLIVEDEFLFAFYLQKQLNKAGYSVFEPVASGEKALATVRQDPPDVILMDMTLAGKMNGLETARSILAVHPAAFVFMTGHTDDETLENLMKLTPLGILTKPTTALAVQQLLQDWAKREDDLASD